MHGGLVPGRTDVDRALAVTGHVHGFAGAVNSAANLLIVAGYLLVPFTVLRYLPLTRSVWIGGAFFFVTCAVTHLAMAFGVEGSGWMVVNHVVQALAVLWFVLGFWLLLREAVRRAGTGL